jgi:hypothetical protein
MSQNIVSIMEIDNTKSRNEPDEFKLFPRLPIELRIKIWKHAQPEDRPIEVHWNHLTGKVYTNASQPVLLQVNHESRVETLKIYEPLVIDCNPMLPTFIHHNRWDDEYELEHNSCNNPRHQKAKCGPFGTYINYERDTLYFSLAHISKRRVWGDFVAQLCKEGAALQKLRHLAFDINACFDVNNRLHPSYRCTFLRDLVKTEQELTIHVVYHDPSQCQDCRTTAQRAAKIETENFWLEAHQVPCLGAREFGRFECVIYLVAKQRMRDRMKLVEAGETPKGSVTLARSLILS